MSERIYLDANGGKNEPKYNSCCGRVKHRMDVHSIKKDTNNDRISADLIKFLGVNLKYLKNSKFMMHLSKVWLRNEAASLKLHHFLLKTFKHLHIKIKKRK